MIAPDNLFFLSLLITTMTNLPTEQCEKKIKLYSLFQELAELSDGNLIPSLLNHFQRESMQFQNTENFYIDLPSNEKKQSKYFMYKNTIDALMWLYVKKNNELESVFIDLIFATHLAGSQY